MLLESISQTELTTRRQKLRRQRQVKSLQMIWRSLALIGITSGLVWVYTLPDWIINNPEQITIKGNKLLSAQAIRGLLPLSYPESLLRVHPQEMAHKLESQPPIAHATVTRELFPPSLTIQVKERQPVAMAVNMENQESGKLERTNSSAIGLLDEQGVWIPLKSYKSLNHSHTWPKLKIIGILSQYKPYWSELYAVVSRSPVKVIEIDFSNPANLILNTQLGKVHFGTYTSRFAEQINVLERLRELPNHLNKDDILYINLKNPESPAVQTKTTPKLIQTADSN